MTEVEVCGRHTKITKKQEASGLKKDKQNNQKLLPRTLCSSSCWLKASSYFLVHSSSSLGIVDFMYGFHRRRLGVGRKAYSVSKMWVQGNKDYSSVCINWVRTELFFSRALVEIQWKKRRERRREEKDDPFLSQRKSKIPCGLHTVTQWTKQEKSTRS